jgi:hypothetical protein
MEIAHTTRPHDPRMDRLRGLALPQLAATIACSDRRHDRATPGHYAGHQSLAVNTATGWSSSPVRLLHGRGVGGRAAPLEGRSRRSRSAATTLDRPPSRPRAAAFGSATTASPGRRDRAPRGILRSPC